LCSCVGSKRKAISALSGYISKERYKELEPI
jgi:hypothetical protein